MKELILVGIFVLGLLLNIFNIKIGTITLILAGSTLAMAYFYVSVVMFNKIPLRQAFKKDAYKGISIFRIIGSVGTGMALSVLVVGMVFKIMYWPNGDYMLLLGIVFCLISIVVSIIKYTSKRDIFYKRLLFRLSGWVVVGIILYVLPPYTLLNMKYKDHPAYREALINSIEHPEDEAIHQKYVEEAEKMERGQ